MQPEKRAREHCEALPCVVAEAKHSSAWRVILLLPTPGVRDLSPAWKAELQRWAARPGWTSASFGKKTLPDMIHAVFAAAAFPECTCFISWPSRLLLERSYNNGLGIRWRRDPAPALGLGVPWTRGANTGQGSLC